MWSHIMVSERVVITPDPLEVVIGATILVPVLVWFRILPMVQAVRGNERSWFWFIFLLPPLGGLLYRLRPTERPQGDVPGGPDGVGQRD